MRHAEKARYLDLFNRMVDMVFLLDSESQEILDANPAAEIALNLSSTELQGKKLSTWLADPSLSDFERLLRIARRKYYPKRVSSVWKIDETKLLHFELVICLLEIDGSAENTVFQVIARDITKEVEAQKELDRYVKRLENLSTHDELTQLANIRFFKSEIKIEHDRAERYGDTYSIILFDVDHFKHYNDRNGHPAGDAILRELGKILNGNVRTTDLAARYGGEEFIVMLRSTSLEGGWIFAERLRMLIEEHPFPEGEFQPLGRISVSIGVAAFPQTAKTFDEIIQFADQGLYQSKREGRNRVTTTPPTPPHG